MSSDPVAGGPFRETKDGLDIRVRLTPRAAHDRVDGIETLSDGSAVLTARVRAVPEKGGANQALEKLIASAAGRPRSTVSVVAGSTARIKTVRLSGDGESLKAARAALTKTTG